MNKNKLFDVSQKSTFNYWFHHWYWYNRIAKEWGVWKFKYLFHDIEKPFLKLFLPYAKVKQIHRTHNRHYLAYPDKSKIDWIALIIDWECSHHSKLSQPMNSWSYAQYMIKNRPEYADLIKYNVIPILKGMKKDKPFIRK